MGFPYEMLVNNPSYKSIPVDKYLAFGDMSEKEKKSMRTFLVDAHWICSINSNNSSFSGNDELLLIECSVSARGGMPWFVFENHVKSLLVAMPYQIILVLNFQNQLYGFFTGLKKRDKRGSDKFAVDQIAMYYWMDIYHLKKADKKLISGLYDILNNAKSSQRCVIDTVGLFSSCYYINEQLDNYSPERNTNLGILGLKSEADRMDIWEEMEQRRSKFDSYNWTGSDIDNSYSYYADDCDNLNYDDEDDEC